jgi:hypothetical protein
MPLTAQAQSFDCRTLDMWMNKRSVTTRILPNWISKCPTFTLDSLTAWLDRLVQNSVQIRLSGWEDAAVAEEACAAFGETICNVSEIWKVTEATYQEGVDLSDIVRWPGTVITGGSSLRPNGADGLCPGLSSPHCPVCACLLVSSLLLAGATMSQRSSLTQSAHFVRQALTAYRA